MLRDATVYRDQLQGAALNVVPQEQGAQWVVDLDLARNGEGRYTVGTELAKVDPLQAWVERGSWMVQCPCLSAALACRTDHRFFCVYCGNVAVDGAWVPVAWPDDPAAIEAILERRFYRPNRNWLPGETLEQLQQENDDNNQAVRR